jgi:hypothetical protein
MARSIIKIYCYVDESGQDTLGKLFIVAVVVIGPERDQILAELECIEGKTGKGFRKWRKTSLSIKLSYMEAILAHPSLKNSLFYAHHRNSTAYRELTINTVATAIKQVRQGEYQATVIVDGLRDTEIPRFARGLRARGVKLVKMRGSKDQSNAFIRLADALAGLMRDVIENQPYTNKLQDLLKQYVKKLNV